MLRGMSVLQKRAILFNGIAACLLVLSVSLWLMNSVTQTVSASSQSVMTVVVSSSGYTPSSATQPPGQITLRVTNQTGESELSVQLYGSRGELVREVNITGATEWSETFELAAGSYTLIAGHKTEWVCHITVQ